MDTRRKNAETKGESMGLKPRQTGSRCTVPILKRFYFLLRVIGAYQGVFRQEVNNTTRVYIRNISGSGVAVRVQPVSGGIQIVFRFLGQEGCWPGWL